MFTIKEFRSYLKGLNFDDRDRDDIVAEILNYGEIRINEDRFTFDVHTGMITNETMLEQFESMLDEQDNVLEPFFTKS